MRCCVIRSFCCSSRSTKVAKSAASQRRQRSWTSSGHGAPLGTGPSNSFVRASSKYPQACDPSAHLSQHCRVMPRSRNRQPMGMCTKQLCESLLTRNVKLSGSEKGSETGPPCETPELCPTSTIDESADVVVALTTKRLPRLGFP